MTTWTEESAISIDYLEAGIVTGNPIGLLLLLTYPQSCPNILTTYTEESAISTTYTEE